MKNVFYPTEESGIPRGFHSEEIESLTEMKPRSIPNISKDSDSNKTIRIVDVSLNYKTTMVDVTIRGVNGEGYILKVNEGQSVLITEESLMVYYSDAPYPLKLSLEKGHKYQFTLFDLHNTPHDVYEIVSPVSWSYVEPVPEPVQTIAVSAPIPQPSLPKTADNYGGFTVLFGFLICLCVGISITKKVLRKTGTNN